MFKWLIVCKIVQTNKEHFVLLHNWQFVLYSWFIYLKVIELKLRLVKDLDTDLKMLNLRIKIRFQIIFIAARRLTVGIKFIHFPVASATTYFKELFNGLIYVNRWPNKFLQRICPRKVMTSSSDSTSIKILPEMLYYYYWRLH